MATVKVSEKEDVLLYLYVIRNAPHARRARKWLEANGITFEERHIKDKNSTIGELKEWHKNTVWH